MPIVRVVFRREQLLVPVRSTRIILRFSGQIGCANKISLVHFARSLVGFNCLAEPGHGLRIPVLLRLGVGNQELDIIAAMPHVVSFEHQFFGIDEILAIIGNGALAERIFRFDVRGRGRGSQQQIDALLLQCEILHPCTNVNGQNSGFVAVIVIGNRCNNLRKFGFCTCRIFLLVQKIDHGRISRNEGLRIVTLRSRRCSLLLILALFLLGRLFLNGSMRRRQRQRQKRQGKGKFGNRLHSTLRD